MHQQKKTVCNHFLFIIIPIDRILWGPVKGDTGPQVHVPIAGKTDDRRGQHPGRLFVVASIFAYRILISPHPKSLHFMCALYGWRWTKKNDTRPAQPEKVEEWTYQKGWPHVQHMIRGTLRHYYLTVISVQKLYTIQCWAYSRDGRH